MTLSSSSDKPKRRPKNPVVVGMTWLSIVSFVGFTGFSVVQLFQSALNFGDEEVAETVSLNEQLQTQERGYEIVLEREPDNVVALEGLANTRMEMGDYEGAIAPLEKLVEMYPDFPQYQTLLQQAAEQAP
ncbi:MAG: tetratricopeptide repeat protein [Synechococcales bacterium]|nr:tetratricopeptide repeat protein [Synechococcales bacterium]